MSMCASNLIDSHGAGQEAMEMDFQAAVMDRCMTWWVHELGLLFPHTMEICDLLIDGSYKSCTQCKVYMVIFPSLYEERAECQ